MRRDKTRPCLSQGLAQDLLLGSESEDSIILFLLDGGLGGGSVLVLDTQLGGSSTLGALGRSIIGILAISLALGAGRLLGLRSSGRARGGGSISRAIQSTTSSLDLFVDIAPSVLGRLGGLGDALLDNLVVLRQPCVSVVCCEERSYKKKQWW